MEGGKEMRSTNDVMAVAKIIGLTIMCVMWATTFVTGQQDVGKVNAGDAGRAAVYVDGVVCGFKECEFGSYLLDEYIHRNIIPYMMKKTRGEYPENVGQIRADATISMLQSGAIRSGIDKGKITVLQLSKVFPDHIEMGKVQMKGSYIVKAIEHAVARYNTRTPYDEFLQVSGLKFSVDFNQPSESRVKDIYARNVISKKDYPEQSNDYPELNRDALYTVILSKHMWNGGDGFVFNKGGVFHPCKKSLNEFAEEKIMNSQSPISPNTDGRIVLMHTDELAAVENAQEIGTAEVDIDGSVCGSEECGLGNFLLDAYIEYNAKLFKEQLIVRQSSTTLTDSSIAILQSSAIRGGLKKGKITVGQLSEVLPDNNIMGKVKMIGSDIENAIYHGVKKCGTKIHNDKFLQVSGLVIGIDTSKYGKERVKFINAKSEKSGANDAVIKPNISYTVILSKNMWTEWNGSRGLYFDKDGAVFEQLKKSLFDVAKENIMNSASPINPLSDGRIIIKNQWAVENVEKNPEENPEEKLEEKKEDYLRSKIPSPNFVRTFMKPNSISSLFKNDDKALKETNMEIIRRKKPGRASSKIQSQSAARLIEDLPRTWLTEEKQRREQYHTENDKRMRSTTDDVKVMAKIFSLLILCALWSTTFALISPFGQQGAPNRFKLRRAWKAIYNDGDDCGLKECGLGNWLLDAYTKDCNDDFQLRNIRGEYPSNVGQLQTEATIAMLHSGAIRKGTDAGKITVGQLLKVFPDNTVMGKVQNMKGSDIKKAIEHGVANYNSRTPRDEFLQVSGMDLIINLANPSESRVFYIGTTNVREKKEQTVPNNSYTELELDALYTVILSKHMWDGGIGFVFKNKKQDQFQPCGKTIYEFAKKQMLGGDLPISPFIDHRIQFMKHLKFIDAENAEEIGTAEVNISRENCDSEECGIGNFLLDAYVEYNANLYKTSKTATLRREPSHAVWTDASIAIIQNSAICAGFKEGKITVGQLSKVLPDNNIMGKVTIIGADLRKVIYLAVEKYGILVPNDHFIQVSGLVFEIFPNIYEDDRVGCITAKSLKVGFDNEAIELDKYYTVIVSKQLWNEWNEWKVKRGLKFDQYNAVFDQLKKSLFDVAKEKLKKLESPLNPTSGGRIIIKNQSKVEKTEETPVKMKTVKKRDPELHYNFMQSRPRGAFYPTTKK